MEDKHRKRIIDNIDRLVVFSNFEKLSHACVSVGLLTPMMLQNIYRIEFSDTGTPLTDDEVQTQRHKRLFLKITKRGPDAFQKLRRTFADLKCDSALQILVDDDSYVSIHGSKVPATTDIVATTSTVAENAIPPDENSLNNNNDRRSSVTNGEDSGDGPCLQNDRRLSTKSSLEEYDGEICPKDKFKVTKARKIHKHPSLDTYPMQSENNRGVFFMVNMIDFRNEKRRDGAEEDGHSLLHLFKEMGFKLFSYTNLSHDEFFKILEELLNSEHTKNAECFVMALMTHGNMDEYVQRIAFSDGSVVKVKEIEEYFYHNVCKNLVNKPKIFLFPFCRGDISERGVLNSKTQTDSITYNNYKFNNISLLSDLIVCYATSEGFKSHRDPKDGSWYIQSFVKNMANNAHDTSFEDIIKKIQADTSKLRTYDGLLQTANFVNKGFNNALYFNPGFWLD